VAVVFYGLVGVGSGIFTFEFMKWKHCGDQQLVDWNDYHLL
jgi:hypothetical protein